MCVCVCVCLCVFSSLAPSALTWLTNVNASACCGESARARACVCVSAGDVCQLGVFHKFERVLPECF